MTSSTLEIALQNQTNSNQVFCYITGNAVDNGNKLILIQSDGKTPYYPNSPANNGSPLLQNCAIPLGAPGSTTTVTIPRMYGMTLYHTGSPLTVLSSAGRVWFSVNGTLTFLLNPGPGLVEPSVSNSSDPNINILWAFCEFTFNQFQIYANISYVDFVALPIALTLLDSQGQTQHVSGMPQDGLAQVCSALRAQDSQDGAGWSQLIVNSSSGTPLRALSPNTGIGVHPGLFNGYFANYVNRVWSFYTNNTLSIDTQAQWGIVKGNVKNNQLTFPGAGSFNQPSTADIFANSSGALAASTPEMANIAARLAAAFNRTTLLTDQSQPDGETPANFYQNPVTNHYARILHSINLDHRGYAFPYDDVAPTGGADQSGFVADGSPTLWTIAVGGSQAYA